MVYYDKNSLRLYAKLIRATFDINSVSKSMLSILIDSQLYKDSKNIMLYYPINSEYDFLPLLSDNTKNFLFPVVKGAEMFPVVYDASLGFCDGRFQIKEPVGQQFLNLSEIDLIIIPALCVSKDGFRLGYGKGYYDKFLKNFDRVNTVVACHSSLVFENIFQESYDVATKYILTEKLLIDVSC